MWLTYKDSTNMFRADLTREQWDSIVVALQHLADRDVNNREDYLSLAYDIKTLICPDEKTTSRTP